MKEIKIDKIENSYNLSWSGFSLPVYTWVSKHGSEASWQHNSGKGCLLTVSEEGFSGLLSVMKEEGFDLQSIPPNLRDKIGATSIKTDVTLKDYQIEDAKKLVELKRCILAHEMGLGKTYISILAARQSTSKLKVIVCPACLTFMWESSILEVFGSDKVIQFKSHSPMTSDYNGWLIITYDMLARHIVDLPISNCVILDECQYIKAVNGGGNPSSKRAKYTLQYAWNSEYIFALSGTPMPSYAKDLYNILSLFQAREIIGPNFWFFGNRYCDPQKIYIKKYNRNITTYDGLSNAKELANKLSRYLVRRNKKDIMPNLKKIRMTIPIKVEITPKMNPRKENFLADIQMARVTTATAKAQKTIEFIELQLESTRKIVVFTCFLGVIDIFQKHFPNAEIIVGSMTAEERTKAIANFQNGSARLIFISLTAGGVGITLTAAHTVIFNDLDFVPADALQAEDRVCRIGQSEICTIYYIVANTKLDSLTNKIMNRKLKSISRVIDPKQNIKEELYTEYYESEKQ